LVVVVDVNEGGEGCKVGDGVNVVELDCLARGETGVFRPDDDVLVINLFEDPPPPRFKGDNADVTTTLPFESSVGALSLCEATRFRTVPVRPRGGGK